ncbi:COX15/CtaA family protein [Simiduia aestuariiviva]|uniref:Cytochrome c oxidase assembly protein subunit 15 n=1 Tax=Simiduia aestuariiviva TaxID=1510459 RepID=A0A839UM96_9GAMM|nr:COX15/CtaA family protein [Simiduia aestuariiviva]MBB3167680.1 cytochrome c oxidase assembly protein subunit 15 [Simiduia aestuariiviva]
MIDSQDRLNDQRIAQWLLFCAAVIFCMIILGGVTRLTESGLSIVDWKPVTGILPPLNEAEWHEEFDRYKAFPEYQQVNRGMSLDEFKNIFYYEYGHRLLGRIIGLLFLLPFLYFLFAGRIKAGLTPKLWFLFILGGLQGVLGWYMVKSGLVDNPRVSQYRLAAHLGMAVLIYGVMVWIALGLLQQRGAAQRFAVRTQTLCGLLFLMILSGALVAGTRAGLVYPTWPLMGDSFIPAQLYATTPVWLAAFEDLTTIQFNHRMFAYALILICAALSVGIWRSKPARQTKLAVILLLLALAAQVSLGIATLLHQVPITLAATHQGVAIVLFTCAIYLAHSVRLPRQ